MHLETPVLAAIASPRRREILRLVWDRELAAGAIHAAMPDVTFGAVSLQLRALGPVGEVLERMWDDALWRLKLQAELEQTRRGPRRRRPPVRPRTSKRKARSS